MAQILMAVIATGCAGPDVTPRASAEPSPAALPSKAASSVPGEPGNILGRYDIGGGRSLQLECRGTGSPTLVFLVGSDAPRTQMRSVEDAFVARYRVCDYDREDPPEPRIEVREGELKALLEEAEVPGPYVLVGQSAGGDIAWLFASRHPDSVSAFISMNPGPFVLDRTVMEKVWTPEEIAGELPEPGSSRDIDGRLLQAADPPPSVPYVVMLSTIAQCGSPTDICGRFYPAYEAWGRELAARSPLGEFVEVEAQHEIFATHRSDVVRTIEALLAASA